MSWHWQDLIRRRMQHLHWRHLRCWDESDIRQQLNSEKKGLKDTKWNGRLTIIHREPLFIVDGAHNPAAADMLEDSVRKYFKGRKLFFIMGVFRDKDYPYIIRKLCPYAEQIITIETPDNPRALPAQELAEEVKKCNPHVQAADSIPDAVDKIFAMAGRRMSSFSFGSLSLSGKLQQLSKLRRKRIHDRFTGMS